MTLLFCDSFDHYATAELARKWTSLPFGGPSITSSSGRGSPASQSLSLSSAFSLEKALSTNLSTVIVGGAFKIASTGPFLRFMDGSANQWHLRSESSGVLRAKRGGTTLGDSALNVIASSSIYYHIEVKTTIHTSTGSIEVRVNGVTVINLTGINTANNGTNQCNRIGVGGENFDALVGNLDDFYICDTAGSFNNDFLGDVRVEAVYPDGAGNSTQFTPSTGSNYQCVDEALVNSDTDYVSSSTAGHVDLYTMGNIAASASTIKAVAVNLQAEKTDVGARTTRPLLRSSGTTNNGATYAPSTSYTNEQAIFENIITSVSLQNSMECGAEVVT